MNAKPQLLANLDTIGRHNGAPAETRARLAASGAWKRQRVIWLIPAGRSIDTKVYLSHMNVIFPPNNAHLKMLVRDWEVGEGYSKAIEDILSHPELSKWEYLLTVEHDNMPEPDGLLRLLVRMEANPKLDCIGGLYFLKGYGGHAQIWGDPKDPVLNFRPQLPDLSGGLVECNGTGMGFNLWRLKMFKDKQLRRPWFVTKKDGEGVATQDLYFWADAKKRGFRCAIDCSVKVGHHDAETDITW